MTIKAVCGPASTATTERWDSALAVGATRLSIAQSLRELCQPPYGANIASAGLLLGVFVAPRSEKLVVVRDGQQLPLSEWLQDGVFRGRFIDLNAIHGVDLVLVGESSSEWETLLDEWEQAESYLEREQYLHRAASLMGRVPVPPAIGYRKMHLEGLAQDAGQKLEQLNRELNDSITKLHSGEQRGDVGLLGWGAASLHDLGGKMASERPFWTDQQIAEVQPHVERARQAIIQLFPEWKQHQVSANGSPSAVGAFQHKMLRQVGVSLRKLDLGNLYGELETYTNQIVRNAEVAAGASQLITQK